MQELVPLKQEGPDTDFRLSCSLPVRSCGHQQGSCICLASKKCSVAQKHRRQDTLLYSVGTSC